MSTKIKRLTFDEIESLEQYINRETDISFEDYCRDVVHGDLDKSLREVLLSALPKPCNNINDILLKLHSRK